MSNLVALEPVRPGSAVQRIDPLRFLTGCHTRRLNQALSVLSLSQFFSVCVVLLTRATFVLCYLCVLSLGCSCYVVSTSASDWLERLISEMTYNVLMRTLNPSHSLTVCICVSVCMSSIWFSRQKSNDRSVMDLIQDVEMKHRWVITAGTSMLKHQCNIITDEHAAITSISSLFHFHFTPPAIYSTQ